MKQDNQINEDDDFLEESEFFDDDDDDGCTDCGRLNCVCDYASACTCGAWKWTDKGAVHVADCICGNGL